MMSKEQATAKAMTELSEHSSVAMKLVPPVFQSMGETLELVPVCGLGQCDYFYISKIDPKNCDTTQNSFGK